MRGLPTPVSLSVWTASLTTSQVSTRSLKCPMTWVMCLRMAAVTLSLPVMELIQPGSWLCHTRVWPLTFMLFWRAQFTMLSAEPQLKFPALGSSESHFISFSAVT